MPQITFSINIWPGFGLLPSDIKQIPDPLLAYMDVATYRDWATLSFVSVKYMANVILPMCFSLTTMFGNC